MFPELRGREKSRNCLGLGDIPSLGSQDLQGVPGLSEVLKNLETGWERELRG